ncbi:hypothetical protein [Glycomyces sp. NRRL B-16210]|uniref:hypothetical protein n=1 Tax=Glycomyces sp. NRRL B-16210 TaxID=1463821 RepID=UPI00068A349B|nr:hypothetical protein [Glycomyces sp. NRRL B-16210]
MQPPPGPHHTVPAGPQQVHAHQPQFHPQAPYGHPVPQPFYFPPPVTVDGFHIVQPRLKPIPSGPAIGSLVAGIGGILGAFPGLITAGFSPWAGLTFFMYAVLLGIGSVGLALYAKRQIKTAHGGVSGRGVATTGLIMGIIACSLAGITGLIALVAM